MSQSWVRSLSQRCYHCFCYWRTVRMVFLSLSLSPVYLSCVLFGRRACVRSFRTWNTCTRLHRPPTCSPKTSTSRICSTRTRTRTMAETPAARLARTLSSPRTSTSCAPKSCWRNVTNLETQQWFSWWRPNQLFHPPHRPERFRLGFQLGLGRQLRQWHHQSEVRWSLLQGARLHQEEGPQNLYRQRQILWRFRCCRSIRQR